MSERNLNGAWVHCEQPAPNPTHCWLTALEARRGALRGQLASLDVLARGADKVRETRRNLVRLAEELVGLENAELERLSARLAEWDADTERALAETGGRARSLRAQLEHRRNPVAKAGLAAAPEDLARIEAELHTAEKADGELLASRLGARERLLRPWREAARAAVATGLQLLALTEPDLPELEAARARALGIRQELEHLDTLARLTGAAAGGAGS